MFGKSGIVKLSFSSFCGCPWEWGVLAEGVAVMRSHLSDTKGLGIGREGGSGQTSQGHSATGTGNVQDGKSMI